MGSKNSALMTTTGSQLRRCSRRTELVQDRSRRLRGHSTATPAASVTSGTKSRKHACPWMRNHPVSAKIHASCPRPAITDAAAIRKTTYVSTYM